MNPIGPSLSARHVAEPLLKAAQERPQALAILDGPRRVDYATLARLAGAMAQECRAQGIRPGDRVLLYLDKSLEAVVALYGCWLAGAVAVQAAPVLKSAQVAHLAEHAEVAALWTMPRLAARLEESLLKRYPAWDVPAALADALAKPALPLPTPPLEGSLDDLAVLLYTSGSTGLPKGIMLSHGNLLAGARIVSNYLALRPSDRLLSVVPFSFDYGLNQLLDAVHCGATLVLQRSPLPADVCRSLKQHRISVLAGVPPFWIQLMDGRSPFPQQAFPDLRLITNTGGVFPTELVARYRAHLPQVALVKMYGLTEAFRSTYLPPSELDLRPASIGKAIPECTVLVLDEQGEPSPPGVPGELVHRGPTVALGYWRDAEATARVFRPDPDPAAADRMADGRPRPVVFSGDLVVADEAGFLEFVSRQDQMIKSLGYRISPTEVESLALASGLVQDAVACGRQDAMKGAVILLHVLVENPTSFPAADLRRHFQDQAPRHLWPADIVAHGHFPRTPNGKVDRRALTQDEAC